MRSHSAGNQRLLDRVCYLSRAPSKDSDLFGNEITVRNTFPYNPDSKTSPETAKRWADNSRYNSRYDYRAKQHIKGPEPEFVDRANDPFSITIIDLDVRSEGGRAYKVLDHEDRCFDLREDQVIEVFKHVGVLPGGHVPGRFVWGILGSQVRLVLVDGDLHKEMVKQANELKELQARQALGTAPSEMNLEFGHIYRKRDGSIHIFLGRVTAPHVEKTLYALAELPQRPHEWDNLDQVDDSPSGARYREEDAVAKRWDSMTWRERCQWEWYDQHEHTQRQYPSVEPGYYHHPVDIVLMSSPKFEAEEGKDLDMARQLRENVGAKHKYVNAKGSKWNREDLADKWWGGQREWNVSTDWRVGYEQRERLQRVHRVKVKAEQLATRMDYQKELKWEIVGT